MIGRDVDRQLPRRLERPRRGWRKLIVRLGVHIIKITEDPQLIVADFVLEGSITAPAFLRRKRAREGVEVKAGEYSPKAPRGARRVATVNDVISGRGQSVAPVWWRNKFHPARI